MKPIGMRGNQGMSRPLLGVVLSCALLVGSCTDEPARSEGGATDLAGDSSADPSAQPDPSNQPDDTAPDVVGGRLAETRPLLRAQGFAISVEFRESSRPEGTILRQTILPGTDVHPRTIVVLVVARAADH